MSAKIKIEHLYKIFGPRPSDILPTAQQGVSKEEILAESGHTLGLRDVSLTISEAQTFVVMGLSGSGKSTLIRHINRLIEPTAGEVQIDDTNVLSLSKADLREWRRRKFSMVFQHFGLLPHRTVLQNVAYGLSIRGTKRSEREATAIEWIENVGLRGYEKSYPNQLSGGMQQRVGLARALATNPEILLMDEAFSALDPLIRREMQDQLIELQKRLHKTIVFITHDLDEALKLGDQIAILKEGEVVQVGQPAEILLNPATAYVEDFVQDVSRGKVLTADSLMKAPDNTPAADLPTVTPDTTLDALLPVALENRSDIGVVDDDELIGVISHESLLAALR